MSMTILGAAVLGGVLDQVQAWDVLLSVIFGNTLLSTPAQIASWLAAILTIALTAFVILKRAAHALNVSVIFIEATFATFKKACRSAFWWTVARPFKFVARWALKVYRWAMGHRK